MKDITERLEQAATSGLGQRIQAMMLEAKSQIDGLRASVKLADESHNALVGKLEDAAKARDVFYAGMNGATERVIELEGRLGRGAEIMRAALRLSNAQINCRDAVAWLEECGGVVERQKP